jgi:hypothetical protein
MAPRRSARFVASGVLVAWVAGLAGLAGCGDDGGSEEAFCETARRFARDNPAAVFDRYDPSDPTGAAALLREAGATLQAWADEAPGDVDDDVETIAEAAEELATAFEEPAPTAERAAELEARFAEVEDASARVTSYARERCGVELDPGAGATVTTGPPTTVAASG